VGAFILSFAVALKALKASTAITNVDPIFILFSWVLTVSASSACEDLYKLLDDLKSKADLLIPVSGGELSIPDVFVLAESS
jgi:hypothetical protein